MPKLGIGLGASGHRVGESHPNAKLSDAQVEALREAHVEGVPTGELALRYEVTPRYVRMIVAWHRRALLPVRIRRP